MLPCGVRQASHASYFAPIYHFLLRKKKKMNAPAGNQTRVSSVAGTYTITVLPALILMSAQLVSTQSDNLVILQDSQCRNAMSAEAMAQWQRVGFQTQRLGVRIPLARGSPAQLGCRLHRFQKLGPKTTRGAEKKKFASPRRGIEPRASA